MTTIRAYSRLSVAREASQQIDQARHLIGRWAELTHPGTEIRWYEDEGVSGGLPIAKRPAGSRLMRELVKGDVLVVSKLDRLARSVTDLLATLEHAEAIGASFVATEQSISTEGPYGRFMVTLLGSVAELERSIMAERQRAARAQLHRDGRHVGTLHYGLTTVPHPSGKGLAVRPHPEEGPRLREAVERVLAGESMASQARELGISRAGMQRLMRSERLIGRTPGNGGAIDPDAALITVSQWNRLRALVERDEPRSWSRTDGYSLALSCAVCQGRLYLDIDSGSAGSYRCKAGHKAAPTISRRVLDRYIEDWFLSHYSAAPVIELVVESDDAERRERLAVVELALDELTEAQRRPGADVLALAQRVVGLHAERAAIEAEPARSTTRTVDTGKRMGEHWAASTDAERVSMLRQVGVFVVHPKGRQGGRIEPVDAEQESERFLELSRRLPAPGPVWG
jgi:DNA invertase Pin-like site-specific DNA recombinase